MTASRLVATLAFIVVLVILLDAAWTYIRPVMDSLTRRIY
jgi:hypothetical protein